MFKIPAIFFLISFFIYPQSDSINIHSPGNKKLFADYLFCEGDYLRAVGEYKAIRDVIKNDTVDYKIILCYSYLNIPELLNNARMNENFNKKSPFKYDIEYAFVKNDFINSSLIFYKNYTVDSVSFPVNSIYYRSFIKLRMCSYLFYDRIPIPQKDFLLPFDDFEKEKISSFYDWIKAPPYKSTAIAGILSAVVPGSGKMYVGEWGDGVTAFIVTGLLAFLAYDNFRAGHNTRAWIFTGLGAFFYAGNIYGSVASAQIFNARIDFEFEEGLNLFLQQKNYFMPEYDFCN